LRAGGRFVMADVVIPDDEADATTPLTDNYDKPDRARDLLAWLQAAQFKVECVWSAHDLAVFVADR
jgi:tRNA (cmo5U34)-methyltransferase